MFFPLLLAISVYLDVSALRQENVWQYYWTNFPAPMSWWATAWFLILILRIRHVHADESGITIFSLSGNKTLAYRNVEYVSEIALTSPGRFALKYTDPQTMRAKKILVIPEETPEMADFIRKHIRRENPKYSSAIEPSRWSTLRLALITAIPFVLYGVIQNVVTGLAK